MGLCRRVLWLLLCTVLLLHAGVLSFHWGVNALKTRRRGNSLSSSSSSSAQRQRRSTHLQGISVDDLRLYTRSPYYVVWVEEDGEWVA
jgi:hypothetical protein